MDDASMERGKAMTRGYSKLDNEKLLVNTENSRPASFRLP